MDIEKYISYYKNAVPYTLCRDIMSYGYNFQPSTYANNKGKLISSDERVLMDECWVNKNTVYYKDIKSCFEYVCRRYSEEFPLFSVQHITDFRINRYSENGFMSSHVDNIHHSHGQQYGYPQVTVLLYLNDDYEGGELILCEDKKINTKKGDLLMFPSNFLYPHEITPVTKGSRYSYVSWVW